MYIWTVDDGSAAHEPVPTEADLIAELRELIASQAKAIMQWATRNVELVQEVAMLRGLLSRMPDDDAPTEAVPTPEGVQSDIDRTIDHLWRNRTTPAQRQKLRTSTERADRVKSGSDEAVGRALRCPAQ